jgi:hypothetical protein
MVDVLVSSRQFCESLCYQTKHGSTSSTPHKEAKKKVKVVELVLFVVNLACDSKCSQSTYIRIDPSLPAYGSD